MAVFTLAMMVLFAPALLGLALHAVLHVVEFARPAATALQSAALRQQEHI